MHETVDVDALDALFAPTAQALRPDGISLHPVVDGYRIEVFGDGLVVVRPDGTNGHGGSGRTDEPSEPKPIAVWDP